MIELTVGQMFACLQPIMAISKQEMGMEQAEKIADFVGTYIDKMVPLEDRAAEMREAEYKDEAEKIRVFNEFSAEKIELPEFSFKEFNALRISPDSLITLKRAGLYKDV